MICQNCDSTNRDARIFCGQCGVKIASPCLKCHFINAYGDIYCGGCGWSTGTREAVTKTDIPSGASETVLFSSKKLNSLPPMVRKELLRIQKETLSKTGVQEEKKQLNQEEIENLISKEHHPETDT